MPLTKRAAISSVPSVATAPRTDAAISATRPQTQHALAAEHVGAAAAEEQEPAVAEHERRDDPLQLALGQVQRRADRRQRDLDEREVERVEEDDAAENDEQQLLRRRPAGVVFEVGRVVISKCSLLTGWALSVSGGTVAQVEKIYPLGSNSSTYELHSACELDGSAPSQGRRAEPAADPRRGARAVRRTRPRRDPQRRRSPRGRRRRHRLSALPGQGAAHRHALPGAARRVGSHLRGGAGRPRPLARRRLDARARARALGEQPRPQGDPARLAARVRRARPSNGCSSTRSRQS